MESTVQNIIGRLSTQILNPLVELMMVGAVAFFIFGIVKYIANADNEDERQKGQRHIAYSLIGLTIMVAAWGILALVANTIGSGAQETLNDF